MVDFLDISSVNISEINYELPENNESFEYLARLSNQSLVFSKILMKVYSNGVYEKNGISYFDLLLGKTHKNLYDFMSDLDSHNVEFVSKNSNTWMIKILKKISLNTFIEIV